MQEPGRARVREWEGTARHGSGMGQGSRKVHEPGRVHECGRVQETGRGQLYMGMRGPWLWHGTGRVKGLGGCWSLVGCKSLGGLNGLGWGRSLGGDSNLGWCKSLVPRVWDGAWEGAGAWAGDISMGKVRRLGRTGASEEQGYGHMTGYRSREGNKGRVWEWGTGA